MKYKLLSMAGHCPVDRSLPQPDIFYIRKGMRFPESGVCNPSARVNKCIKRIA